MFLFTHDDCQNQLIRTNDRDLRVNELLRDFLE